MEKAFISHEDKAVREYLIKHLNKYSGEPLAIFDIYRERGTERQRKKKKSPKKIFVGRLDNVFYRRDTLQRTRPGNSGTYMTDIDILSIVMKVDYSEEPAIYYLRDEFKRCEYHRNMGDVTVFDIPCKNPETKVTFTPFQNEFEDEVKKIAGKETEALKDFLEYSKRFW